MRRVALLALVAALCVVSPAAAKPSPPRLLGLHVTNGSTPFLGDDSLLTTVSPNGDGFRDAAHILFRLSAPAKVSLAVVQTGTARSDPEERSTTVIERPSPQALRAGLSELVWTPKPATPPRTYVLQLTVSGPGHAGASTAPACPAAGHMGRSCGCRGSTRGS